MKNTHTPGPWSANTFGAVRGADGYLVAEVLHAATEASGEANVRLIAAAPDLLAACEAMVAAWDGMDNRSMGDVIAEMRHFIAKAGGAA